METVTFAMALLAGAVSVASPCVLPLLPGVMAYSAEKGRLTPLAIVLGLAASFTAMGVLSSALGSLLMDYIDYIKLISGVLIIVMGLYILSRTVEGALLGLWERLPISRIATPCMDSDGLPGGLLLGLSLGILWMPCVGPILASILMIAAQQGAVLYGASLLLAYSLGLAIPMLMAAYSSSVVSARLREASKYSAGIRKAAGIILLLVGAYYLSALGFLPSII
ncbi:Cytochrome c biogenesis protein [Methanocella conradii HZ254]|uniref:Cytochrome c biogenesis protein n=1 Tax=Methanocella conradii (strain DSM 24694 / JCM 17849 / CGMCC 1.5162 / HZ254) TaxID=1041930 RepID=H8I4Y5_METCZ|nr:Cytochrome c biogenesis protein [Methanocella conradii HZ254]